MADVDPFKYQASTNIKEHNEIVDKVNEIVGVINDINLDGLDPRLTADEVNIKKNSDDIAQLKISDNEHTAEISTLETNVDNHAREITAIKAKDITQDNEIKGLSESVVSDLTGQFDNNTRILKLSVERENAPSIDCNVVIPSGGTTGQYTGGNGINIDSNNVISAKIDDSTIKVNTDGQLYSVGGGSGGQSYTAGTGIEIQNNVIKLTPTYDSWIQHAYTSLSYVDSTERKFIFKTKSGINDKVSLAELAFKSDINDMETKTNASATYATKQALFSKANQEDLDFLNDELDKCYQNVSISGNTLTFVTVANKTINIELPGGSSGNYVPASYPVENAGKILGINGDGAVEPKDSDFVEPLFKANLSDAITPSTLMSYLKSGAKVGSMITFSALGKTATSWSGTISGVVTNKSNSSVTVNYIGGILQENGTILTIGALNYSGNPSITFSEDGVHVYIVKGNAINGRELSWNDVQGYNVIIYR